MNIVLGEFLLHWLRLVGAFLILLDLLEALSHFDVRLWFSFDLVLWDIGVLLLWNVFEFSLVD